MPPEIYVSHPYPPPNLLFRTAHFFRKLSAFWKREWIESLSYKMQFLIDAAVLLTQAVLFFTIARLLPPASWMTQSGAQNYFEYVFLGLGLLNCQSAALEGFSKAVYREQAYGTLEAVLLTPTSMFTVVFASYLWSLLAAFFRFTAFLAAGFFIFKIGLASVGFPAVILTLFLTLTALSGFGLMAAAVILVSRRGEPVSVILNGVSKLLAGVYFPAALFPEWVEQSAALLPLTHSLEAMRKAVYQGAKIHEIQEPLGYLFLFSLVLLPAGAFFLKLGFRKAREDGSLGF
jgi:ABC-2 type transport system permease protein